MLQGQHGHSIVEVVYLEGGRFEAGHKILQWLLVLLPEGEEAVSFVRRLPGSTEVCRELLLQLGKGVDAPRLEPGVLGACSLPENGGEGNAQQGIRRALDSHESFIALQMVQRSTVLS